MNVGSDRVFTRFIPAGAGNTETAPAVVSCLPVYPRWRGEHNIPNQLVDAQLGLSPLARGTQRGLMSALNHHRFIPAGAGNTMLPSFTPFLISVYPRWRGEHHEINKPAPVARGLSPLARGTPSQNSINF
ncbi:Domain of uncharacterised function (DUF2825) [Escherichia coli]|nr:Domain of uncharacterised function (DUF2825) [Escherichia coli]